MKRITFETAKLAYDKGYRSMGTESYTSVGELYEDLRTNVIGAPFQAELQEWIEKKTQPTYRYYI